MEILVRSYRARRPGGTDAAVHEYCEMIDHSLLRNGSDWLPGAKRYALSTGEPLRPIDAGTFQLLATGELVILMEPA